MRASLTLSVALLIAAPAALAEPHLTECGWQADIAFLAEPWAENSKTFANGDIRLVVADTLAEPICCPQHILILAPDPQDPLGGRFCRQISDTPTGLGFLWARVGQASATYDPATGLTVSVPVERYDAENGGSDPDGAAIVRFVINQAAGTITLD